MVVCIFGASSDGIDAVYMEQTQALGEALAKRGHSLIFPSSGLAGERVPARDLHALVRDTLLAADFPEKAFRSGQSSEEFSSRILSEHIFGIRPDSSSIINNEMIDSLPICECRTGFGIALAWNRSDSDMPAIELLREAAEFISNQA